MISAALVDMPTSPATHIQTMAPGPPIVTAVATPAMFPTPTVLASAVHPAAKLEMVPSPFSPFLKSLPMEFWNMNLRENWYLNLNLIVM